MHYIRLRTKKMFWAIFAFFAAYMAFRQLFEGESLTVSLCWAAAAFGCYVISTMDRRDRVLTDVELTSLPRRMRERAAVVVAERPVTVGEVEVWFAEEARAAVVKARKAIRDSEELRAKEDAEHLAEELAASLSVQRKALGVSVQG